MQAFRVLWILLGIGIGLGAVSTATIAAGPDTLTEAQADSLVAQCIKRLDATNDSPEAIAGLKSALITLDNHRHWVAWRQLAFEQAEILKLLARAPEAMAIYRSILAEDLQPSERAKAYNRMAATMSEAGVTDSALYFVNKSISICRTLQKRNLKLDTWNAHIKGYILLDIDHKAARKHLLEALTLAEKVDTANVPMIRCQLGNLAWRQGDLLLARQYFADAAAQNLRMGAGIHVVWIVVNLAELYHKTGDDKAAYHWLWIGDSLRGRYQMGEVDRSMSDLKGALALAREAKLRAEVDNQKNLAEARTSLAFGSLAAVMVVLLLLGLAYLRADKQKQALAEASARLEASNQTKNVLMGVIGHDLRAPLASLQGIVGLLELDDLPPAEIQQLAQSLGADVQAARSLLDDLLLWAKSELNGLEATPAATSIYPLADEVLYQHRALAKSKHVRFAEATANEEQWALAHPALLKTVLRNLVVNAINHCPAGGMVAVEAVEVDGHVRLSVYNPGPTLPEAQRNLLTTDGLQDKALHKKENLYQGFGLLLVRDFTRLMRGHIEVEIPDAGGTRITIVLPAAEGLAVLAA